MPTGCVLIWPIPFRRQEGERKATGISAAPAADEEEEEEDEAELAPRLEEVLMYLRLEHRYCFFCGHAFTTDAELQQKCPGVFERDHE